MILSFHPLFEADVNINMAGRKPGPADIDAIKAADACILSQGCSQILYELIKQHCPYYFPNYDARFSYQGKLGQSVLFEALKVPYPKTDRFATVDDYETNPVSRPFPFVFKFDWGGEGETVFMISDQKDLDQILEKASSFERTGQFGFLIQEYIHARNQTLRVVVIGQTLKSYWRVGKTDNAFYANTSKGAVIEHNSYPELQKKACKQVMAFTAKSKIDLAGIDILFAMDEPDPKGLFLEINYYFGRQGLGGSEAYYRILGQEIRKWLATL